MFIIICMENSLYEKVLFFNMYHIVTVKKIHLKWGCGLK